MTLLWVILVWLGLCIWWFGWLWLAAPYRDRRDALRSGSRWGKPDAE